MAEQIKGKVKWFDVRKGHGFITDEEGNDHFAHFSGIVEGRTFIGLRDGDEVTFEVVEGKRGSQAGEIRMIPRPKKVFKKDESETEVSEETVEE